MAKTLLGKPVADALVQQLQERVAALGERGVVPGLAILRVGERGDDLSYERGALKRAGECGIAVKQVVLPADATTEDILAAVDGINADPAIHGCLMFRPLPRGVDEATVCERLDPAKDVDGMTRGSLARVISGKGAGFGPCTAAACIDVLDHYEVPIAGAHAVVVGRSLVIGKPVAHMLLERNATVTICHSRTPDLPKMIQTGDIVVCATGRARAYSADCFRPGQTVLDVGINFDENGTMCGDVDFDAVEPIVDAITPSPRGVGSVTTAALMRNVVQAAENAQ